MNSTAAPPFPCWLDRRSLHTTGQAGWDAELVEAIRNSRAVLYLMTSDAASPHSVCLRELQRALGYKRPILPLRLVRDVEQPLLLGLRQHIDLSPANERCLDELRRGLRGAGFPPRVEQTLSEFYGGGPLELGLLSAEDRQEVELALYSGFRDNFRAELAKIRSWLRDLESPRFRLKQMDYWLEDLRRGRDRTTPSERARFEGQIAELQRERDIFSYALDHPEETRRRDHERIERDLESERFPARSSSSRRTNTFINRPPVDVVAYFQGRQDETASVVRFLRDSHKRLICVSGRAGSGKTTLACRVLKGIERGRLPDDHGPLAVAGIVYLSAYGRHPVTYPAMIAGLSELLPDDKVEEVERLSQGAPVRHVMASLLEGFTGPPAVVLLDNFEDVLDPASQEVQDSELSECLEALLKAPAHSVKVIVTTREESRKLLFVEAARVDRVHLGVGLEHGQAVSLLLALDRARPVGLAEAPREHLEGAAELTRGNPRALEALHTALDIDAHITLGEMVSEAGTLLPEEVTDKLVGEATLASTR